MLYIHTPVTTDSPNKHPRMYSVRGCPVVVFIALFKDVYFGRHACLDAIRILWGKWRVWGGATCYMLATCSARNHATCYMLHAGRGSNPTARRYSCSRTVNGDVSPTDEEPIVSDLGQ